MVPPNYIQPPSFTPTMRISARAVPIIALLAVLTHVEAFRAPPISQNRPIPASFVSTECDGGRRQGRECSQCALSLSSSTYNKRYRNSGKRSSKNTDWAKLSTGLLPEAGYFKAERDEERLQLRRQREVDRAMASVPWGSGGGSDRVPPTGGKMRIRDSVSVSASVGNGDDLERSAHDMPQERKDNNYSNRRPQNNGKGRGPKWPKGNYEMRRDDSIFESFRPVENVDQLNRMVDDVLVKLDNGDASMGSREATDLVRLLGARQAYKAMLKFVRHPATHQTVFSYTAACASLAQSPKPKYRSQSASLLDEMDALDIQPNTYTFTAILLGIDGGKGAMKMMKRARQYDSVDINCFLYNAAIHACSRSPKQSTPAAAGAGATLNNGWQTALSLFRQMKKEKIRPTEQTYASLLHACGKSGQVKLALSLLNEMKNNPSVANPDAKVWGAVLQVLASAGDYKKAMKIMREMVLTHAISPNVLHCNALLASLSKARKDDVALDLLGNMINGTLPEFIAVNATIALDTITMARPDLVSVNTVLAACARKGNFVGASEILGLLKRNEICGDKWPIRPDTITYNTLLSACRRPEDAEEILDEMRLSRRERYSRVKPTSVTYVNGITVCRKADPPDLPRARKFLESAIREGIKPNVYMYSAAIWCAEYSGDADAAMTFLDEMKSSVPARRCDPNAVTYDGCMSALASDGRYKEVIKLFREMKDRKIEPLPSAYKRIAIATTKANLSEEQVPIVLGPIVRDMTKKDLTSPHVGPVLATLIRSYGSRGMYNKAKKTFRLIRGPTDSSCLSAMLFACAKSTKWQDALFFLHTSDIVADARGPGRIDSVALTYASIACARADQWREALNVIELYGRFDNNGEKAVISINAVNALISACGRSGRADMAVKLLNEMPVRFQCIPDAQTYKFAIIAANQAEKRRKRQEKMGVARVTKGSLQWWEVALSLLRRMKEDGLKPDKQVYSSVISACESDGQWQRALGVLRSMSVTTGGEIPTPPNLFCFNSAIAACQKGGAWLEAVELYERIRASGNRKIRPNFVTINSLLIALEEGGQREMAESIYKEALHDDILLPWRARTGEAGEWLRAMDLHQYSVPLAKVAVRTALESLLTPRPQFTIDKDLVIIVGKGNRSETGEATLRPVILELLDDMAIPSHIPETNVGRIIISASDLSDYVQRMSWRGDDSI